MHLIIDDLKSNDKNRTIKRVQVGFSREELIGIKNGIEAHLKGGPLTIMITNTYSNPKNPGICFIMEPEKA